MSPWDSQRPTSTNAQWFATTRWSVVLAAGHTDPLEHRRRAKSFAVRTGYPIYAYVRKRGYNPEDAEDLPQAFLAHFLDSNHLGRANRHRGRFRSFLLTSLQNFLAHEWERTRAAKRGGSRPLLPCDEGTAEGRYHLEPASDLTPDSGTFLAVGYGCHFLVVWEPHC